MKDFTIELISSKKAGINLALENFDPKLINSLCLGIFDLYKTMLASEFLAKTFLLLVKYYDSHNKEVLVKLMKAEKDSIVFIELHHLIRCLFPASEASRLLVYLKFMEQVLYKQIITVLFQEESQSRTSFLN